MATKKKPAAGRPRKDSTAPALDRERIVAAALALIDSDGVAALNLRKLAGTLGVAPAAIYWHVAGRDELVSGALNLALQGLADGLPAGAWQDRLRELLQRFRAALRRHPGLAPVVASELVGNAWFDAGWLDAVVALLEEAGFDGPRLVDAYNVVIAALSGFVTMELSAPPAAADWRAAVRARLAAVEPEATPALARHLPELRDRAFLLRWSGGREKPLQGGFDAWVEMVVRGLEATV